MKNKMIFYFWGTLKKLTYINLHLKMKHALLILCCIFSLGSFAQVQDPNSPGFDLGTTDTTSSMESLGGEESGEEKQPEAPPAKPYERIKLNVDSVTNLITYTGVVEQEESSSDSLYARAKKWAMKQFNGKPVYEADKKNQKLVISGYIVAYAYGTKYTKREIGKFNFKMTIWFKEGRYRYGITNLVHEGIKGNTGTAPRNYFEYYYTTTSNIKQCDQTLRFADKDLNKLIEDFVKAMKDPIVVDEEDW